MATLNVPEYLKDDVGYCVICGELSVLSHDGRCRECWDNNLKPPRIKPSDNRGNGSRDEIILDMADSHIPHAIIAMKFGLRKSTVRFIIHKMRVRRRELRNV